MPDHTCTHKKKENQNQLYHTLTFSPILHQSNQLDVKEEIVAFITYPQNTQHTYLLYILSKRYRKQFYWVSQILTKLSKLLFERSAAEFARGRFCQKNNLSFQTLMTKK